MPDWKSEVEWSQYYPDMDKILDEEFFWSMTDDLSPNGCDAGADAECNLIEWFEANGTAVLPKSGCEEILNQFDHARADIPDVAARPDDDDPMHADLCRIMVGLAFAHFKLKGNCPAYLSKEALALLNVLNGFNLAFPDWQYAGEWKDRFHKMASQLTSMPRAN